MQNYADLNFSNLHTKSVKVISKEKEVEKLQWEAELSMNSDEAEGKLLEIEEEMEQLEREIEMITEELESLDETLEFKNKKINSMWEEIAANDLDNVEPLKFSGL